MNRELFGLRVEIVGLFLVLAATLWQGTFTDWFDGETRGSATYTQEMANVAILRGIDDLSSQIQEVDPEKRREARATVYENIAAATRTAFQERDSRRSLEKGQAKVFSIFRYIMLIAGASCIVLGKWLVLAHKSAAAGKASESDERAP